jgi:hypothetical protein
MENTHILETTSQWLLFCLLAAIIQKTTNHGSRMTETINIDHLTPAIHRKPGLATVHPLEKNGNPRRKRKLNNPKQSQ